MRRRKNHLMLSSDHADPAFGYLGLKLGNTELHVSGRGLSTKVAVAAQLILCSGAALVLTPHALAQDAATYPYSYSGRLADASGAPQSGQVDVMASFWSADVGGTRVGQNFDFAAVNLSQGVFTLNFARW
ncbi:MAG: hypothetical protein FJ146_19130 [Deltaproteobacteria bacterium]|nr:hypothetical protein [Deltaproteobacteria bacterium]